MTEDTKNLIPEWVKEFEKLELETKDKRNYDELKNK